MFFRSSPRISLSQTLQKFPSEVGGVVLHGAVARSHRPVWIFMDRLCWLTNNQQRRR